MAETGINAVMRSILRLLLTLVSGIAGYQTAQLLLEARFLGIDELLHPNVWTAFCIFFFAALGYLFTAVVWRILKYIGFLFENMLQNVGASDVAVAVLGLIVGLVLANLIALPFVGIPGIGFYVAIALNVICAYVGIRAFLKRRDDIRHLFMGVLGLGARFARREKAKAERDGKARSPVRGEGAFSSSPGSSRKVLDTSALIDGRILEIAETGFLEGDLLLPRFVLTELQGVADSSDPSRRARGRKGLSVVSELQSMKRMRVEIQDVTMKELKRDKVDEALVELCKRTGARIVTTDYNLNQISRIEGVEVLNVNDLANSLRPQFLPGEQVRIDIIRPGKEAGQGVGYLEDGTMLVVEDGESDIGETSDVTITSMLQTSAGRMVFGKLKR